SYFLFQTGLRSTACSERYGLTPDLRCGAGASALSVTDGSGQGFAIHGSFQSACFYSPLTIRPRCK
ncbi:MAG: hypothetical protein IJI57_09115, partial [Flexilinea sp.]|nr:hypothetical protein [Flexilinea sp.]